ncbi:uncharacterized protein LOC114878565 isoform X1 [Osmia bicornis bicornis]|uniref:uncharacterized protein LOC114878565 isoform X1 n=1 Tax=Osmia bicornis bicornis TaxID=1437191 RepID=UPI001EAE8EB9|nr:uncharacterized protein LOC114878565 isoform X1 [Osmia bicornis bicornis]
MRCIAVGCTSGYKSNPENVHFFRVPKNKNKSEEWQKACRRKDLVLNSSHCFCEHHFAKEDIICKKIFRNKDGEIIQEIPLKRAYLKEGAVPSMFPWTEFGNTGNTESTVTDNADNINNICIGESTKLNYEDISDTLTFNELKCNDKLYLPVGWNRNTFPFENTSVIIFYRMICKINETESQLISIKEIWITEDMKMQVKALGKPINLNIFGISNEFLSSLNILEDLIKMVETFQICKAYEKQCETECTSVALKESNNILRHQKCPVLLKDLIQCDFCKSLSYTLDRKRKRLNDKGTEIKRIRVDYLSPTKKNIIDDIRKQKYNLTKFKNRKICTIEKIRGEIEKIQEDLNERNKEMLENVMKERSQPINKKL